MCSIDSEMGRTMVDIGWMECKNPVTNESRHYHVDTEQATWSRPRELGPAPDSLIEGRIPVATPNRDQVAQVTDPDDDFQQALFRYDEAGLGAQDFSSFSYLFPRRPVAFRLDETCSNEELYHFMEVAHQKEHELRHALMTIKKMRERVAELEDKRRVETIRARVAKRLSYQLAYQSRPKDTGAAQPTGG